MSSDANSLDPEVERSVLGMYKSLTSDKREIEEDLLTLSISEGIVPRLIRYGIMHTTHRGVVKATDGTMFYMHYAPGTEFRLVKADTPRKEWECENLLKACVLGCDLIKSYGDNEPAEDGEVVEGEEEEEVEKAPPGAGSGSEPIASRPPVMEEEQKLREQHDVITDQHPGSAGATTPDQPWRGKDWHGTQQQQVPTQPQPPTVQKGWDLNGLLRGLSENLQKSIPPQYLPVDPKEQRFMMEELGRSPQDIEAGNRSLSPMQRVQYNRWLNKSLKTRISGLQHWLDKNGS